MNIHYDPQEKINCPYNSSHYIMRKRMDTHLVKCKKNYPESPFVECDFNTAHKIPAPELQYHYQVCPDRRKMEITVYQDTKTDLNKFPIYNTHVPIEENWDNENVLTYDPTKYCLENEIIRHKDVAGAAERRNFRMMERQRIAQFSSNKKTDEKHETPSSSAERPRSGNSWTDLPDVSKRYLDEAAPDSIDEILQRIKKGANKSYIPKN